jgi:flavin reductase (DIM6/NTAB) family NADH-FMN oxidoreductase RutF
MLQTIPVSSLELNPFHTIAKDMMLITAGETNHWNTMTASWGGMGELWGKDVLFIFVRKSRYTHEFLDASDGFTCSFFPPGNEKNLRYLGNHSGRDEDKVANVGFHSALLAPGRISFTEANLVFSCRKLYKTEILPNPTFLPEVEKCYGDKDYHTLYVGEVEAVYAASDPAL